VKPPALLQVVKESVYPGAESAYSEIEVQIARAAAELRCPNPYLALASTTLPREVWWLNAYTSQGDVDRVSKGYLENVPLMAAMQELAQGKKGLTTAPVDRMATLRADLSDGADWRVGELPFVVIREMPPPASRFGAVYQLPDGAVIAIAGVSDRTEADRLAATHGGRVFEVRVEWSFGVLHQSGGSYAG
jgi:hypothetical protein